MDTIDKIIDQKNIEEAIKKVRKNKGAPGIDNMTVFELEDFFMKNWNDIRLKILNKQYVVSPVKRIFIPKPNSNEMRPLGIPCCKDRVIQQATAKILSDIYEPLFSEHSHGFRPNRSCHTAMEEALGYLNEGYEWVVDFDIQKFFDTVNHDKLISIIREQVNDSTTLHLIRSFLKAGIMENGLQSPIEDGVPQGSPFSPIASNIYLDKLDKELESRGLRFVRYADDFNVFVKSEAAANRVMKSVSSWIERKLYLKVSPAKTKVVRPTKGEFLGFGFYKNGKEWKCKPLKSRLIRLRDKIRDITCRKKACARPLSATVHKINEVVRGWINYYKVGSMKTAMKDFGTWLRHKVRVIMLKQWKTPTGITKGLNWYCRNFHITPLKEDTIHSIANSRKGLYARSNKDGINFILNIKVFDTEIRSKRKGKVMERLINPLAYYLNIPCNNVLYIA